MDILTLLLVSGASRDVANSYGATASELGGPIVQQLIDSLPKESLLFEASNEELAKALVSIQSQALEAVAEDLQPEQAKELLLDWTDLMKGVDKMGNEAKIDTTMDDKKTVSSVSFLTSSAEAMQKAVKKQEKLTDDKEWMSWLEVTADHAATAYHMDPGTSKTTDRQRLPTELTTSSNLEAELKTFFTNNKADFPEGLDFLKELTKHRTKAERQFEKSTRGLQPPLELSKNVHEDDVISAKLYTYEKPRLYAYVNRLLRENKLDELQGLKLFFFHLRRATQILPGVLEDTVVFRGFPKEFTKEYKVGGQVVWNGFSSTSTNRKVAESFGAGFMCEIHLPAGIGCMLKPYSVFKHEDELLLPPFTTFNVAEITDSRCVLLTQPSGEPPLQFLAARSFLPPPGSSAVLSHLGGSGRRGFKDGGPQTAEFNSPSGLALDLKTKNLFLADQANHAIRMVTPEGLVTTIAGTGVAGHRDGPGKEALFNSPSSLVIDGKGALYVTDSLNHCIRSIDLETGLVSTFVGEPGRAGFQDSDSGELESIKALFNLPVSIAAQKGGGFVVVDYGNRVLRLITKKGKVSTTGQAGPGEKQIVTPAGVAIDSTGEYYVADYGACRLIRVTRANRLFFLSIENSALPSENINQKNLVQLFGPRAIVVSTDATMAYVVDINRPGILAMSLEGDLKGIWLDNWVVPDEPLSDGSSATIRQPTAIAVDDDGVIYVADSNTNSIFQIRVESPEASVARKEARGPPGEEHGRDDHRNNENQSREEAAKKEDPSGSREGTTSREPCDISSRDSPAQDPSQPIRESAHSREAPEPTRDSTPAQGARETVPVPDVSLVPVREAPPPPRD
eukprot:TRINITY_DN15595_c0_g1_i1.p1 TRINITY_DN15595_c0_g1~~TRINITY_DN15595_c0_g1_i1.p1  ORF type:complete len:940 (+),score=184.54 TRINITY_DN15595_c0_g1_i1:279-2822(+)